MQIHKFSLAFLFAGVRSV
uniref:Uncharacterized protein n=1 Tax=Rhizophora mucronata TaxID=61149 RepID=A0A2P2PC63_RHIMU